MATPPMAAQPKVLAVSDLGGSGRAALFEGRNHGASVSFFLSHHPPGTGPELHRHPYEETFIVQRGSVRFTVEDEEIEARAGQIVIVPAGAAHRFVSTSDDLLQVSVHPSDHLVQERVEDPPPRG